MTTLPEGYVPLVGSELHPSPSASLIGPADATKEVSVTITIRRSPEQPPPPSFDYFLTTPPSQRQRLPDEEFASRYGASSADIESAVSFLHLKGLEVVETHRARRTIRASGTVAQMESAFSVKLHTYKHHVALYDGDEPQEETYRGQDGPVHVPNNLVGVITGVFGLDTRRILKRSRNRAVPSNDATAGTEQVTVSTLTKLYNFPTNSAQGQTVGILSQGNYNPNDITATFAANSIAAPNVYFEGIDGASNNPSSVTEAEDTMDICISGMAAPGASIAVYRSYYNQQGWVDLVNKVAHPGPGDPVCSVLTSSWYISNADDPAYLSQVGVSQSWLTELSARFQDAALQAVTVCIACGDTGSDSKVQDGRAHVQYPGSDPWILSIGGTTVSGINYGNYTCTETVWNDNAPSSGSVWGATGGGVSAFFPLPSYQNPFPNFQVPPNINGGGIVGRGLPDVAAASGGSSPYGPIVVNGQQGYYYGTSAASPLWAGFVARLNASLGTSIGFINPFLYSSVEGLGICTDINNNADNSYYFTNSSGQSVHVPGYPAKTGWDCCTGWGSMNGQRMLQALAAVNSPIYIRDYVGDVGTVTSGLTYLSPDIIVLQNPVPNPQASFGAGSGTENSDTLSQSVIPTQDQSVYVRLLNRGNTNATNVGITVYWSPPSTFVSPQNWNNLGTTTIQNVPTGNTLTVSGAITWPKANIPTPGHYCFIAIAGDASQPAPPIPASLPDLAAWIQANPQVAMRNFDVVDGPPTNSAPANAAPAIVGSGIATTGPGVAPGGFHTFPLHIPGGHDAAHVFQIESCGTLPEGPDTKIELHVSADLAKILKIQEGMTNGTTPQQQQPLTGDGTTAAVVVPLLASGPHVIGAGELAQNSNALVELRVKIPDAAYTKVGGYEFYIRQVFEGTEVGRFTWHFGRQ